jgi:hypothetical protein
MSMTDRRRPISLQDCALPMGVRLVLAPSGSPLYQRCIKAQVVWTFTLVYEREARIGTVEHTERYEPGVPDIRQIRWAIDALMKKVQLLRTPRILQKSGPVLTAEHVRHNFGAVIAQLTAALA